MDIPACRLKGADVLRGVDETHIVQLLEEVQKINQNAMIRLS